MHKKCCGGTVWIDEQKIYAAEARNPGTLSAMIDALGQEIENKKKIS